MQHRVASIVPTVIAFFFGVSLAFVPNIVEGQIANFVFTTSSQNVEPGVSSEQIAVQAQGSGGESVNIPQTGCLLLGSASPQGQFSSNATNWNPVSVLTMNRNTANRNFYYKDSTGGTHVLTVKVALKPEDESRSCANWPVEEWNIQWVATQNITIGGSSQSGSSGGNTQPPNSSTSSTGSSQASSGQSTQGTGVPASYVPPPEGTIFASAGENRIVIVGADVEFAGRAYNKKKEPLAGLVRYSWNFGDGASAEGQAVFHRFAYPGRYAVTLTVAQETESVSDTVVVEAKPAQLRLTKLSDGALAIENLSDRDVDLSRWTLSAGGKTFALPKGTTILADATVTFSPAQTGLTQLTGEVAFLYPNGVVALRAEEGEARTAPASSPVVPVATPPKKVPQSHVSATPSTGAVIPESDTSGELQESKDGGGTERTPTSSQTAAVSGSVFGSWKWWLGALGIAALAAAAVVTARRFGKKEWNIIEE